MKSPYERVGAKGSWQSISNWWYCSDCDNMKNLPEIQISNDVGQYLEIEAAEKFPTISKIRKVHNSPYVDMQELKQFIESPVYQTRINLKKGFLRNQPGTFSTRSVLFTPRAGWICSECEVFQIVDQDIINKEFSEKEILEITPVHCGADMKLGNISYYHVERRFERDRNDIIALIDAGDLDTAADAYLVHTLRQFSDCFIKRVNRDFIYFHTNHPELTKTFEFQLIHHFLSLFARDNLIGFQFSKIPLYQINSINLNQLYREFIEGYTSLDKLIRRYETWKLILLDYIREQNPSKLFDYLSLLWSVDAIVEAMDQPGHFPDVTGISKFEPEIAKEISRKISKKIN